MGAETGTVRRGIRLDREALVKETLVINLAQKVPQGLYIPVVIGDVRVVHINPITYALCHVHPFLGVFHDLFAAGVVILFYGYCFADILFVDTQLLFYTDLYRQAVSVPTCPSGYFVTGLGLVAADGVLD